MLNTLLNAYETLNAATTHFLGFVLHGIVYGGYFREVPLEVLRLSTTSSKRHAVAQIRVYFHKATKLEMVANGTVKPIGTVEDLIVKNGYNRGDNFERLVAEINNIRGWKKNSVPFWIAGDLFINGEQVQVKFDGAELVNETKLNTARLATA